MRKVEKETKSGKIGVWPFLCWNLRGVSTAIQVVLIGYITFYCTDVLGLNAAIVATLLMVSKIFDGVTDLLAGYLVDNTRTKWGKGRPYELAIIGLWLCTWLMFTVPTSLTTVMRYVWVVVMYTCAESIFYTLLNANGTAYVVRAFNNQEVYVKLSSLGGLLTVIGVAIFNIITPTLIENAGVDPKAWSTTILMMGIPLMLIGLLRFVFVPEKYDVDVNSSKISMSDVKTLLTRNKYIYIISGITLISGLSGSLGVAVYYYTYIVKNLSIMGIMSVLAFAAMPTMIFYPMILKKITIRKLIQIGCVMSTVAGVIMFLAKDNLLLLGVAGVVGGMGSLPISMMSGLMLIECADFNEWEGRQRMEGTIGSVNGFASKIGSALGTFLCGVLLALAGYNGVLEDQPDSAMMMIRVIAGLIPASLNLLAAIGLNFYKLDTKIEGMRLELEERRSSSNI